MPFTKTALLSLTMGLVAPWSALQGMAAYSRETMPRKCRLPPRYGWCKESFQNFYYDFKSSMCKTFIYSGCRGNRNNFVTLLDCFLECGRFGLLIPLKNVLGDVQWTRETPRRCRFGRRRGWCKKYVTRYYFDSRNKRCRPFIYGGCGGSANNFPSYRTCAQECEPLGTPEFAKQPELYKEADLATCEQPMDRGPCTESFPRFYYDAQSKNCSAFDFGGCNGNRNNFMTVEECIWECVGPGCCCLCSVWSAGMDSTQLPCFHPLQGASNGACCVGTADRKAGKPCRKKLTPCPAEHPVPCRANLKPLGGPATEPAGKNFL